LIDKKNTTHDDSLCAQEVFLPGRGVACAYAHALLRALGVDVHRGPGALDAHPSIAWAHSGAMALTGLPDGPPLFAPGPLASCAVGAARALDALCEAKAHEEIDAAALLGERAAVFGASRQGRTSPGGSCRLLRAADGWIALNLARPEDIELLPAWLGESDTIEPWAFVSSRIADRSATALIERARLMGLPSAVVEAPPASPPPWFRIALRGPRRTRTRSDNPRVVDLSALWAGPLCTHLLERVGADVIKIESPRRPDGARKGPAAFYDLLNGGKRSVALDFQSEDGIKTLRHIMERADIVIEGSRPRALAQLGIDAAKLVADNTGLTWVSLSGYGRREPQANWVAFGDDAGAAAGLAAMTGGLDAPLFCGDALPDPLTGLHAALAALAAWRGGGGVLLELSLCEVTQHALLFQPDAADAPRATAERRHSEAGWEVVVGEERTLVAPPRSRERRQEARPMGADTEQVLKELGLSC